MAPDERVAEIKRLVNQLNDRAGEYAEANPTFSVFDPPDTDGLAGDIQSHLNDLYDQMQQEIEATQDRADEADREANAAQDRLAEFEGALTWEDERPIWYEAKGRIMEGQDPKEVLAWVLTWVSGEDILL